jgi:hypothetical protein
VSGRAGGFAAPEAAASGIGRAGTPADVWTSAAAGRPAAELPVGRTRADPRADSVRAGGHTPGTAAEPRAASCPAGRVSWAEPDGGAPRTAAASSVVVVVACSADRWSAMTEASAASGDSNCWMDVTGAAGRPARRGSGPSGGSGGWSVCIYVPGGHRSGPPRGRAPRRWRVCGRGRPQRERRRGRAGPVARLPAVGRHDVSLTENAPDEVTMSGVPREAHDQRLLRTLARAARRPLR